MEKKRIKKMSIDKKVYNNTAKCPSCNKKMYYSRKGRVYFEWVGLVNKDNDVIEYYMCPFDNAIYDRWNGNKVEKAELKEYRAIKIIQETI